MPRAVCCSVMQIRLSYVAITICIINKYHLKSSLNNNMNYNDNGRTLKAT